MCPITKIALKNDTSGNDITSSDPAYIVASLSTLDVLKINNKYSTNTTGTFFIQVETIGKVVKYKEVNVTAIKPYIYLNQAPQFKEKLQKQNIEVTEEEQEKGLEDPMFVYSTPDAYDIEDNDILIEVSEVVLPCKCLKTRIDSDNKFHIEVDKSQLTKEDSGLYTFVVSLTDEKVHESQQRTMD